LALLRAPRGPRPGPEHRLPPGIPWLLRIVSGDEEALVAAQLELKESAQTLRDASSFYLQQVLFAQGVSLFVFRQKVSARDAIGVALVVLGVVLLLRAT